MDPDEVPSISRISEHLWLGNMGAAADADMMRDKKLIINCTPHLPNSFEEVTTDHKFHIYHRIPVLDLGAADPINEVMKYHKDLDIQDRKMLSYWDYVVPLVMYHWLKDDHIFIHCHAGAQRSAATMAAVLGFVMCYKEYVLRRSKPNIADVKQAVIKSIHARRPIAFGHGRYMTFEHAFDNFLINLNIEKMDIYINLIEHMKSKE